MAEEESKHDDKKPIILLSGIIGAGKSTVGNTILGV